MTQPTSPLAQPTRPRFFVRPSRACAGVLLAWFCSAQGQAQPAPVPTAVPEATARGLRWMNERSVGNCVACHSLPGHSGVQSNFGPALAGVATRYSPEQLRQWVTDARRIKADTLMPPFGSTEATHRATQSRHMLSPAEIEDVVAALQSLR